MIRRPTGSTRTDTLVPDTTLGRAAGVVPGGLRRGVEDRPGCGGQRAHEYGGRHPRMIDPGILQFPVFDEHPDLHRLAYHFRSEEHTSELQSLMRISYAVFCLKKKKTTYQKTNNTINIHTVLS